MTLSDFRQQLEQQINSQLDNSFPTDAKIVNAHRPFVCQGSPLDCEIMMVGYNPSRDIGLSVFDPLLWNDENGFDKVQFLEIYDSVGCNDRECRWSRSQILQQALIDELTDYAVLETYLYSNITSQKRQLKIAHKSTHHFHWLFNIIKPKLLFIQHTEVMRYLEQLTKTNLTRNNMNEVVISEHECFIYPISHLSKKWSFKDVSMLREEIDQVMAISI